MSLMKQIIPPLSWATITTDFQLQMTRLVRESWESVSQRGGIGGDRNEHKHSGNSSINETKTHVQHPL